MKSFLKNKVIDILSYLSRKTIAKYKPFVIGITGNIGKTTTKDYIYNFLSYKYGADVRASEKSQNSEFGVNLTILGEKNAWNSPTAWFKMIIKNYLKSFSNLKYPKILVLEVGADKPGDIKYITKIVKPDMVVLTAFQMSPTHGEYFTSKAQHINEKKVLVDKMKSGGVIVYNSDDLIMTKLAVDKKEASGSVEIFSFGYSPNSNVMILDVGNLYDEEAEILGLKARFRISLLDFNEDIEIRFLGIVGVAHVYSIACAITVAILHGYNKEDIFNSLKNFERNSYLPKSRMRLLQGINNSKIIDDSYNSSPKAAENAIDTVSKILTKGKKIGILGHMAELGDRTKEEHFNIGLLASKVFDVIILSGRYNEYYMEGIREGKFDLKDLYLTENPGEVLDVIDENILIKNNDLVLIKGSQSARLEKVVASLLVNPRDREEVCRQDIEWQHR